jgi:uncharacterized protein YidB (DUF937 family)/outer membrane protein OmpA-like peptidoglycan-associated protein
MLCLINSQYFYLGDSNMFETIIREAASRFGLGDKAGPLVQMLLAYLTNKDTGGLAGFMSKLSSAGLGNITQSWLGGGANAQPVNAAQLESMLGGQGGLLGSISSKLGIGGSTATSALGFILPAIIGKLTPGGSVPTSLPADVMGAISGGKDWISGGAAAVAGTAAAGVAASKVAGSTMAGAAGQLAGAGGAAAQSAGGGLMKWLPWIAAAIAGLFMLSYCNKGGGDAAKQAADAAKSATTATAGAAKSAADTAKAAADAAKASADAAAKATADAAKAAADAVAKTTADAAKAAADAAAAQTAGAGSAAGARVVAAMVDGMPALKVYFDSGKVAVASEFGDKSKAVMDFLKSNASAKAVVSGFNDPTGNAAANAELSKGRAKNVAAAIKAAGMSDDRIVLEKAADTTAGAAVSNAEARRVEVTIRK